MFFFRRCRAYVPFYPAADSWPVDGGVAPASLLNTPQHGIKVVSRVAAHLPVSCLNDGIIVATGSTPGRRLFNHTPGPPGSVDVDFAYNGRRITLVLKQKPRQAVSAKIKALKDKFALENDGYGDGVHRLGLNIWENWHRHDLFEIIPAG